MYRKQVRRRRAVLVLLVVACLVLISTHFSESESGPLHSVQNGVGAALGPLEDGASQALKPIRDLVNWFDETFDARGENEQLKEENQELRAELNDVQENLEEGIASGKVGRFTEDSELAAYEPVQARVAIRSPSTWTQTMTIDKGSSDGVELDDAVVTGDGLVGRVSQVGSGNSRVALLTNQESGVAGSVAGKGITGLVTSEAGDPSDLLFELVDGKKSLDNGDEILTSGFSTENLSSRYPPGIPIGEVKEDSLGEFEETQRAHVDPFADLTEIDFVFVLTGGPS